MSTEPEQQPLWDWNDQPVSEPTRPKNQPVSVPASPQKTNPCIALYGPHNDERVLCKDCVHLVGIALSRTVYKCELRENTRSARTDHRLRWPACARFEEREGEMRIYDGRM